MLNIRQTTRIEYWTQKGWSWHVFVWSFTLTEILLIVFFILFFFFFVSEKFHSGALELLTGSFYVREKKKRQTMPNKCVNVSSVRLPIWFCADSHIKRNNNNKGTLLCMDVGCWILDIYCASKFWADVIFDDLIVGYFH